MKAELRPDCDGDPVLHLTAEGPLETIALGAWINQAFTNPNNVRVMPERFYSVTLVTEAK